MAKWEYDLDTYSYDDGGLAAMFKDRTHLERRRDEGWYIRETFRSFKGVDVLWEREIKKPETPTPSPEQADSAEHERPVDEHEHHPHGDAPHHHIDGHEQSPAAEPSA